MIEYAALVGWLFAALMGVVGIVYFIAMLSGVFAATYQYHKLKRLTRLNHGGDAQGFLVMSGSVGHIQTLREIVVRTLSAVQEEQQGQIQTEKVGVHDSTQKENDPRAAP